MQENDTNFEMCFKSEGVYGSDLWFPLRLHWFLGDRFDVSSHQLLNSCMEKPYIYTQLWGFQCLQVALLDSGYHN